MNTAAKAFKPSQIKLILAAERLFAEHGIDNVPLTEIALAAGQANNAAVHYHFGSREALVAAISAYRIAELDRIRAQMLDDLMHQGSEPGLRALIEILFRSQLAMADERGCHPYAQFMVQYLTRHRPAGTPHASDARNDQTEALHQLLDRIEAQLPDLPPALVRRRLEMLNLSYLAMLTRHDQARLSNQPCLLLAMQIQDAIAMTVAGIQAPLQQT
ncbi:TetR/AcrR family transcriptional regulator [Sphingobium sp. EM0848]|uniref:TetR/AcrR family transcriptional regulator n=1 Tax=Sphingobium sp. EM0848 TaxID=2743473 RepID=UPI00159C398C|nr:TetR/AcrR family transcriptional regulator [Sphingobium sp. EM0848]